MNLEQSLLSDSLGTYLTVYFCAIAVFALWETAAPRRPLTAPFRRRWSGNFAILILDQALIRYAVPILPLGVAVIAVDRGWGLLQIVDAPWWVELAIAFMVIDFARYVEHWLLHRVPLLWRVHGMHHTDQDYDFTTGIRFHPLEVAFTMTTNVVTVILLGAPVAFVFVQLLIQIVFGLGVHGNIRLPRRAERIARRILVTPEIHCIHHSTAEEDFNRNLGSILTIWDRFFGTYADDPAMGHAALRFGLAGFEDGKHLGIGWMLLYPFIPRPTDDAGGVPDAERGQVPAFIESTKGGIVE